MRRLMKPMMNDDGLLACPFCNSKPYHEKADDGYFVACEQCGCSTDHWLKLETAIMKWNTRNGHLYTADDYKQDAMERANGL